MAIIRSATGWGSKAEEVVEDIEFSGRVIEVVRFQERRNMSDTLDYTDWRIVDCVRALVWLGPVGKPNNQYWATPRSLDFHEQFVWIDCSNHFSDRMGYTLHPEVDAWTGESHGDPLMWANLLAWRGHQEAKRMETVAKREAEDVLRREKFNAELEAKRIKEEKLAEGKAEAERLLRIYAPSKGTEVTVDGVTGTVFWSGSKYYRGAWRSTVGVKDMSGTAHWIDIKAWMPTPEKKRRGKKSEKTV